MAISTTELVADIKPTLGSNLATEAHNDTKIKGYINKAIRKLDKSALWNFNVKRLTQVTDGITESYTIDFQIQTFNVKKNGTTIDRIYTIEEYFSADDSTEWVAVQGDKLYTMEAGTFLITYRGTTTRITTIASGNIELPELFYEALMHATLYYGFIDIKDFDRARNELEQFNQEVTRLRATFDDTLPNQLTKVSSNYSW